MHAGFIFTWGVSLTHPRAGFIFIWGMSLTHPSAGFIFIWGMSLTHPVLASFLSGEFLLHIPCWFPFLFSFLSGEFLLHITCWLLFLCGELIWNAVWRQPLKKRSGWKMAQKKKVKKSHSEKEPYNTLYRAEQNQTRTEWQMATEKKGEWKKWIPALNKS